MKINKLKVYASLLFLTFIWGGSFIAAKIAMESKISPTVLATLRFALTVLCFIPIILTQKQKESVKKEHFLTFLLLGISGISFYYIAQFSAVKMAGPSTTSLIIALIPVAIAVTSFVAFKEPLTKFKIAGMILSCLGAILIVVADFNIPNKVDSGYFTGILWGISNIFLWTFYTFTSKKLLKQFKPIFLTFYTAIVGTATLIPVSVFDKSWVYVFQMNLSSWLSVLFLAVFCTIIGYTIWSWSLTQISASQAAVFIYFEPVCTILISYFLLKENFNSITVVSTFLIILGVFLVNNVDEKNKTVLE